jgi:hypothetical protein
VIDCKVKLVILIGCLSSCRISIAIVKYSAQNCLNAVVSTDLFAYSFKMSSNVYAVKQGERDDNMVNVNLTIYA